MLSLVPNKGRMLLQYSTEVTTKATGHHKQQRHSEQVPTKRRSCKVSVKWNTAKCVPVNEVGLFSHNEGIYRRYKAYTCLQQYHMLSGQNILCKQWLGAPLEWREMKEESGALSKSIWNKTSCAINNIILTYSHPDILNLEWDQWWAIETKKDLKVNLLGASFLGEQQVAVLCCQISLFILYTQTATPSCYGIKS